MARDAHDERDAGAGREGGETPLGYRLTVPMESLATAHDFSRVSEMSLYVVALVNHISTAEHPDQRLSFASGSLGSARVIRAGYGSPWWMEVIQMLTLGGWVVGVSQGVKIVASAVETLGTLPAKVQRPYLENRKLDAERQKLDAERRQLEQALGHEAEAAQDTDAGEESGEAGDALAEITSEGPTPELAPGVGTSGVVEACDRLLNDAQDDGTPEFSAWQSTVRRARRDAENSRVTNEVRAIGYLFSFARSDGSITERDEEAA